MMVVKIKKQKTQKKCIKRTLKFRDHGHCLEATQVENKITHLQINIVNIDCLKKIIKNS